MRKDVHLIIVGILLLTGLLLSGVALGNFPNPLNLGDLKPGQRITITFKVTINTNIQPHIEGVSNQARVSGTNFPALFTDDPDTSDANDPTETTLEPPVSTVMNLPVGWSMISLPLIPYNAKLSKLFPEAVVLYDYEKGIGYDRVTEGEELEVGRGYWILLDQNQNYMLTGKPFKSYTLPVYEDRWIMIGGCTHPAQALSNNSTIDVIYGYIHGVGFQQVLNSESIEHGKGYWIFLSHVMDQAELKVETTGHDL